MAMTIFYRTQQFQKDFVACHDNVLKQEIEVRLEKLEKQPNIGSIQNLLDRYAPHIFVMKIFGQHNARVIIQEQKFKGAILYFIRCFFEKSRYDEWRNLIEPKIRSGLWQKSTPLSTHDLETAFGQYQTKKMFHQSRFEHQRVRETQEVPAYMRQNWFFRQLQYNR